MCTDGIKHRRERLHELLLALIEQQADLELMDADGPTGFTVSGASDAAADAARWMERNRRDAAPHPGCTTFSLTH